MTEAKNWKPGLSITPNMDPSCFAKLAEGGLQAVEMFCAAGEYPKWDWSVFKKNADDAGIMLWSIHLPFANTSFNIANLDADVRETTLREEIGIIKKAGSVGVKMCVIHPSSEPISPENRPDSIKYSKEGLIRLADAAEEYGMTVCVEDLPRTCLGNRSAELLEIVSCDDRLRICFDTNHMISANGESNAEFIRAAGHKIATLHVSDYNFVDERHWLPGEGDNNWPEIISLLEEANYNGAFIYELGFGGSNTIRRDIPLTCGDFRANFEELSAKKIPAPKGVRLI